MSEKKQWNHPKTVFEEYKQGQNYKDGLGARGLYEQNRINQRFYEGDQWYGVQAGDKKALVRYNIIRRAGKYMQAMVDGKPLAINFSAEGVPCTQETRDRVGERKKAYREESVKGIAHVDEKNIPDAEQVGLLMDVLGNYHKTTAERLRFDMLKSRVLERSFVTGTGLLYTYWDDSVRTGQFADEGKKEAIRGDIACEVLDVENVYFGDPTLDDVQAQPYIIIAQRRSVEELKREARRNGRPTRDIEAIKADGDTAYMAGARESENEPADSRKATVLTKLYKAYSKDGNSFKVMAVRVVEGATIRTPWDTNLCRYPVSKFSWGESPNRIYGYSEVTHLIPNQIEVNKTEMRRVLTVKLQAYPQKIVDISKVANPNVLNTVGGTIRTNGTPVEDVHKIVGTIPPAQMSPDVVKLQEDLINVTRDLAGAGDTATGQVNPESASGRAILAVQQASQAPMTEQKESYKNFVEDVARIWLDHLIVYSENGVEMEEEITDPATGEETVQMVNVPQSALQQLQAMVKIDITPKSVYDRFAQEQTLENLLMNGLFNPQRIGEFEAYVEALDDDSVAPKAKLQGIIKRMRDDQKKIAMIDARAKMIQQRANQFLMGDPDEQASQIADARAQMSRVPNTV